ncbi:MAG: toast rack family protein [Acidobacteriota bacterium]
MTPRHRRLVIVALTALASACTETHSGPPVHEHFAAPMDKAESTRVGLSMGAGKLTVKGGAGDLVAADFTYNVPEWKPSTVQSVSGTQSEIQISQGSSNTSGGNTENQWDVALNDTRPLTLIARVGAGEARMTLGSLNLRRIELAIGAGQVDVDLRGNPTTSYVVSVQGGVGQATIHLPKTVAISASASGGLGDISVKGLEKRDGRWINPAATSSAVTIELDVRGGVGQIELNAE